MYFPYFRGKQYELITIRESARLLTEAGFCPVIEPVNESLGGLKKALDAVGATGGRAIVIVNPRCGDLADDAQSLATLLQHPFMQWTGISPGILLKSGTTAAEALAQCDPYSGRRLSFVHAGFTEPKLLLQELSLPLKDQCHLFIDQGKLYQKHFKGTHRVLLKDGFERKRNRDYPLLEPFSDLHATYQDEGVDGFGDFLTVGDDYTETGGPAYAVAIHLTFINPDQDDLMLIYHFKSTRQDTPADPAGKFAEALEEMMRVLDASDSKVLETKSVSEFRELHRRGHFPGLGYVKKLSMNHHIETLAHYFRNLPSQP